MGNTTIVIILCGGNGSRWNRHLGVEKHNIAIDGETLVGRTIRLVNGSGIVTEIYVVLSPYSNSNNLFEDAAVFCPIADFLTRTEADKFLSSSFLWNTTGRTVILFGDVWYSARAILRIMHSRRKSWVVFGRQKSSILTNCAHGELFAWSFFHSHAHQFTQELNSLCNDYYKKGIKISSGWGHYNIKSKMEFLMSDTKIIKGHASASNFIHIDDFTDDFDYPEDYHNWMKRYSEWKTTRLEIKAVKTLAVNLRIACMVIYNIVFEVASKRFLNLK